MCENKCKEDPYYKIGIKTYLEMQKHEIIENKYYMSQKLGYEVGFNTASMDYIEQGHAQRFRKYFVDNHHRIELCKECGLLETILVNHDMKRLHNLLGDGKNE